MAEKWLVETDLSEEFDFYTRANIGEVFPDPVAPLSFFYFQKPDGLGGAEMGFRRAYYKIGAMSPEELPDDECVFLGVVNGYGYLNATALRLLGHRAPGMTAGDIDAAFFGDAPGVPEFVVKPGFDRDDLTAKVGETFGWVLTTPDLPDVLAEEKMVNALRANRPDLTAMSDRELIDRVMELADAHFEDLFAQHIFISFLATLPIGIITAVCAAVGRPGDTLKLLAGLGDVESAAPSMAMWKLGRIAAASDTLNEAFSHGHAGLFERLNEMAGNPDVDQFLAEFEKFEFAYGCRGPNEWEARSPTWETDPALALAAIDRMRLSPESASPQGHNAERAAEREALGAEIAAMVEGDPETHGQFVAALASAKVFMPGRERTKTNCIKLVHEFRICLMEWGKRNVAAGTFPKVNSYGMLTRPELYEFLDEPSGWYDTLIEREALYDEVSGLQEAFLFVGHPGPMTAYTRRDAVVHTIVEAGEVIQGVPGCPGISKGIALGDHQLARARRSRPGRHPRRPDHRPVVDPAVRPRRRCRGRRGRPAVARHHREP